MYDQGHPQAGDTHSQGLQPFEDTCGQGTIRTRVVCNEVIQPSWGHTWGHVLWGHTAGGSIPLRTLSPEGGTRRQGTHAPRGHVPPGSRRAGGHILLGWDGHAARGHVPQGSTYDQGTRRFGSHPPWGTQAPYTHVCMPHLGVTPGTHMSPHDLPKPHGSPTLPCPKPLSRDRGPVCNGELPVRGPHTYRERPSWRGQSGGLGARPPKTPHAQAPHGLCKAVGSCLGLCPPQA